MLPHDTMGKNQKSTCHTYINSGPLRSPTEVTLSLGCQIYLGFNLPNILDLKLIHSEKATKF